MSSEESFDYGGGEQEYEDEPSYEASILAEGEGGDEDSPGGSEESFGGDESPAGSEESPGGRSPGEGEIEYAQTFADIQRTGGAVKTKESKASRTPEQAAVDKAQGILSGESMYENVRENEKNKILALVERVPNVERCSIEVLVPALLFKVKGLALKKDFGAFFKRVQGIEAADLLRYIRQYSELK